ncbi:MAG TPA: alpha/beta hydrolase-fold protein [Steroidobacteraceae bacterium]|nr:alpha/beta hydrolase-fold protein [Steroidobacteraceae bacterium]
MTHRLEESADAVVLAPATEAAASVIWLHGLGADGHDFVPIVPELGLPASPAIRFIFPHAPVRPVTLNMGMRMRAWYDIKTLTAEGRADEEGIRASTTLLVRYIQRERDAGIASQKIVVAGFSQGGAIALHAGLRHPEPLAGILALSTYLPLQATLTGELAEANRATPILMCHGIYDPVLPAQLGAMAREWLRTLGYAVEWHEYAMQHQVCLPEIQDIAAWLRARLATG